MTGHWRTDTANVQRAFDTEAEAKAEQTRLQPTQAVVWYCVGGSEDVDASETPVIDHRDANSGRVGSGVVRKILGRQIEDTREAS